MVRIRNHANTINHISDANGALCSDRIDIERAFTLFYTNLWTEPSDRNPFDIALAILNDLPQISNVDGQILIRDVSCEEIYFTISNLPFGKSLGPDGITVEFFKFFWNDIGAQLTSAVQYFF